MPEPTRAAAQHRWVRRTAPLAVAVVLVAGGTVVSRSVANAGQGEAFRTATVTRGDVQQTLDLTGSARRVNQQSASFAVAGSVSAVRVAVGDQVHAGQVLATLDRTPLQHAVTDAEAALARAQATLDSDQAAGTTHDVGNALPRHRTSCRRPRGQPLAPRDRGPLRAGHTPAVRSPPVPPCSRRNRPRRTPRGRPRRTSPRWTRSWRRSPRRVPAWCPHRRPSRPPAPRLRRHPFPRRPPRRRPPERGRNGRSWQPGGLAGGQRSLFPGVGSGSTDPELPECLPGRDPEVAADPARAGHRAAGPGRDADDADCRPGGPGDVRVRRDRSEGHRPEPHRKVRHRIDWRRPGHHRTQRCRHRHLLDPGTHRWQHQPERHHRLRVWPRLGLRLGLRHASVRRCPGHRRRSGRDRGRAGAPRRPQPPRGSHPDRSDRRHSGQRRSHQGRFCGQQEPS